MQINFRLILRNLILLFFIMLKKKETFELKLKLNEQNLKEEKTIRYSGILMDSHLNGKPRVMQPIRKLSVVLVWYGHYVNINVLTSLYYLIISPY